MSTNKDRSPVASDILTWCTREKTDTWHVVRNHNARGVVDRVVCKACGSEHQYRIEKAPAPAKPQGRSVVVRSARSSATEPEQDSGAQQKRWLDGIKRWGEKPVRSFDATQAFMAGEVIAHPSFGKGVVQARRENKIDVLFGQGVKTLLSAAAARA